MPCWVTQIHEDILRVHCWSVCFNPQPLPCHVWPRMHTTIVLRNFHFVAEYFLVLYSLDFADRFLNMYECSKKFISLQKLYIVKGWQRLLY